MTALYNIGDFVEFVEQPAISTPMPSLWYLLRLHPNCDLRAERQLLERGISVYVPKEKQTRRGVWKRKIVRDVPIFPGSMFVPDFHADIAMLKQNADGIGGFVKYCGEALKVSLRTMVEVRRFEAKRNRTPDNRKFHLDQKVRVIGGPFDMLEGRIDRLDSRYRIRVLIEILGARSPIQFDEDQVEAV
jgi:transcriptional antiterminator NusG